MSKRCRRCMLRSERKIEMSWERKKKRKIYERKKKKDMSNNKRKMSETKKRKHLFDDDEEVEEEEEEEEEEEDEQDGVICEDFCLTEVEQKKRVVLMCIEKGMEGEFKMIRTNPHRGILFKDTTPKEKDFLSDLLELNDCGMVALESKLYFIGGYHYGSNFASKKVFVYDILSGIWYPGQPSLNVARANPTVVTYQKKIYVFGFPKCYPFIKNQADMLPQHWAEYYDPSCGSWKYLPGDDLLKDLLNGYSMLIPVVIENQHTIVLCVQGIAVYRYCSEDEKWFRMINLAFSPSSLFWSDSVVAASGLLFWHHHGTIYAYDFQPISTPVPMFTLPDAVDTFGELDEYPEDCHESFLIHAGNGKICLIYKCPFPPYEDVIRCHTFQLQHSRTTKRLTLNHEGYHSFQSEEYEMFTVFTT